MLQLDHDLDQIEQDDPELIYQKKNLKKWITQRKRQFCPNVPSITLKNYRDELSNTTNQTYLIQIERVNGIQISRNNISIQYHMFLFDTVNKVFVGRKYTSPHVRIRPNPNGFGYSHNQINMSLHTKALRIRLIIEITIISTSLLALNMKQQISVTHIGWHSIDFISNFKYKCMKQQLLSNSPYRLFTNHDKYSYMETFTGYGVQYSIKAFQRSPLQYLIKECCIVGQNEIICGLKNQTFETDLSSIELLQKVNLQIDGISIQIPIQYEEQIMAQIPQIAKLRYRMEDMTFSIIAKRLLICYHNTWTIVSQNNNFIDLKDHENFSKFKVLISEQSCIVEKVFIKDDEIFGAIVFQLQFDVEIKYPHTDAIIEIFYIGLVPFNNLKIKDKTQFCQNLITAPIKSIDGQNCFKFYDEVPRIVSPHGKILENNNLDSAMRPQNKMDSALSVKAKSKMQPAISLKAQKVLENDVSSPKSDSTNEIQIEFSLMVQSLEQQIFQKSLNKEQEIVEDSPEVKIQVIPTQNKLNNQNLDQLKTQIQQEYENQHNIIDQIDNFNQTIKQDFLSAGEKITQLKNDLLAQDKQMKILIQKKLEQQKEKKEKVEVQNKFKPILDEYYNYTFKTTLKEELLRASEIYDKSIMKTLVILKFNNLSLFFKSDLKENEINLPNRILFKINFFDFETYQSEILFLQTISYQKYDEKKQQVMFEIQRESYIVNKDNHKNSLIKFDFLYQTEKEAQDFVTYCKFRKIFIQLYDADTMFHMGNLQLPIYQIFDSERNIGVINTKESLHSADFQIVIGSIQIEMEYGHFYQGEDDILQTIQTDKSCLQSSIYKDFGKALLNDGQKKKIVSTSNYQITLRPSIMVDNPDMSKIYENKKDRINQRIQFVKSSRNFNQGIVIKNMPSIMVDNPNMSKLYENKKDRINQRIQFVKSSRNFNPGIVINKVNGLKNFKMNNMQDVQNILLRQGESQFVIIDFQNDNSKGQFKIEINDPDQPHYRKIKYYLIYKLKSEVEIQGKEQLLHYLESNQIDIQTKNQLETFVQINKENNFELDPLQKISALIRLITLRTPLYLEGRQASQSFVIPRQISITIHKRKHTQELITKIYNILPIPPIVELVFNLNLNHEQESEYSLPPLFTDSIDIQKMPTLLCTGVINPLMKDGSVILQYYQAQQCLIFVYRDEFFHSLIASWQICFQNYQKIIVNVIPGQKTTCRLLLNSDIKRMVKVYSSDYSTLWFEDIYSNTFDVTPKYEIEFQILSTDQQQPIYINAKDANSNELIAGWVVNILYVQDVIVQIVQEIEATEQIN